jgi:hypothetical protein
MKGATLITNDVSFLESVGVVLQNLGFEVSSGGGYLQAIKDRTQLMFHPPRDAKTWKSEVDPGTPNLNRVEDLAFGYFVECRWESLFCQIVRDLAKRATKPFFVVNEVSVYAPDEITPSIMAV